MNLSDVRSIMTRSTAMQLFGVLLCTTLGASAGAGTAAAAGRYDPGASNTEIRIGQTMPYSGPVSTLSAIGKVQTRYFRMVNDKGGIRGRKVNLISLDDGYNPAKGVEQTRKLIESDRVLFMFSSMGTPTNAAVQQYLNSAKIPQLFVFGGSDRFADSKAWPWTVPGLMLYSTEGSLYAEYVARERPQAKVAILYQNDDFGKSYVAGFTQALARLAPEAKVVAQATYEYTAPTVDSQVISLAASNADVFLNIATPKFTSQAIRKAYDLGWRPMQFVTLSSTSVPGVLAVAGVEKSTGVFNVSPFWGFGDPERINDANYKEWIAFMGNYYPEADLNDPLNLLGYSMAVLMHSVLEACGDDLTRENVMRQALSIRGKKHPSLQQGITLNVTEGDRRILTQGSMRRFDGQRWVSLNQIVGAGSK